MVRKDVLLSRSAGIAMVDGFSLLTRAVQS